MNCVRSMMSRTKKKKKWQCHLISWGRAQVARWQSVAFPGDRWIFNKPKVHKYTQRTVVVVVVPRWLPPLDSQSSPLNGVPALEKIIGPRRERAASQMNGLLVYIWARPCAKYESYWAIVNWDSKGREQCVSVSIAINAIQLNCVCVTKCTECYKLLRRVWAWWGGQERAREGLTAWLVVKLSTALCLLNGN